MLHSICQQIWNWKRSVFIPIAKKGNAKESSNYYTIALISQASKVVLKILQARLQQYVNWEFPDVQTGFSKGRGARDQIANIQWSQRKQENSRKISISASLTTLKPLTVWITTNWKILKEMGVSDHLTCLLRNLYAGQEAPARTGHGTMVSSHGWESTGAASWPSTLTKCSHPWWGLWSCLLPFFCPGVGLIPCGNQGFHHRDFP